MSLVDNKGNNILHIACHGGHLAIVKYIMSLDIVDINSRGQYGRTSAMTAAYNGKSEVLKFLVGKGANMSQVDKAGDNILHISCRGGHVGIVKYIISLNIVDINSRGQHGRTSVMMAAQFGHREVFDICACEGGNVSQVDAKGCNILFLSCLGGHVEMVKYIFSQNITGINSRGMYRMTPLHMAARKGHREVFELVVDKGGDTSLVDANGDNILHLASIGGHLEIIKYILSRNITVINIRGIYGRTSVVLAARGGHRDVFDYLVHKGCNMSFVDNKGNNILHMACHGGHLAIVKYIMSLDIVDINSRGQYGRTSAMTAAYNGKSEVFKFLVGKGANVSLVDKAGDNILHISCRGGHVRMVKYIISLNIVDINSRGQHGRTSVMMAAQFGHREVFDICACEGGNVSQVDAKGSSILHMACLGGHVEMVKYIFSQNITDINSRGMYRMTPLHLAAFKGHREVFELVVDKGGDTSLVEISGDNILHLACIGGNVEIVKYILSQNIVDINSRGMYERTPLMMAALFGHREAFELVLDKGGDTSLVDTCGVNILHLACIGGNVAIVKYILSRNFVDINSRGKIGRTPVMVAAAEGHIDLCYLLISKGSDLSVVDDNGCTILHVACYHGQVEIVRCILSQHVVYIDERDKNGNTAAMIAKRKLHKAVYALVLSQS